MRKPIVLILLLCCALAGSPVVAGQCRCAGHAMGADVTPNVYGMRSGLSRMATGCHHGDTHSCCLKQQRSRLIPGLLASRATASFTSDAEPAFLMGVEMPQLLSTPDMLERFPLNGSGPSVSRHILNLSIRC